MKAWRKHNSSEFVREHPAQKLTNKTERRTQFASELAQPSNLLYAIMYWPNYKDICEQVAQHLENEKAIARMQKPVPIYLTRVGKEWIRPVQTPSK